MGKFSDKASVKKSKFLKNSSFTGVETHKSPKNRRKTLATVLPTPLKQSKTKSENKTVIKELSGVSTPKADNKKLGKTPKSLEKTQKESGKKIKLDNSLLKTPKRSKKKETPSSLEVANGLGLTPKSSTKQKRAKANVEVENVVDLVKSANKMEKKIVPQAELGNETDFSAYEDKFNIKTANIKKGIEGVIKFATENPKLQNKLFNEQIPLFLQINIIKIPTGHPKILRIPLKNSVLTPDDDICLIVPELKGVKNKEHEKHVDHYENLLRSKGVTGIKKIMTFHEFRTEYETFELKARLADLYDLFLVDGKISGKVVAKCGKIFYQKRKVPTPVKLNATKLKQHIDQAIRKAYLHLNLKSDSYMVQFGHSKMNVNDLIENAYNIIEFLNKELPGGFDNIRNINIYSTRASSIPVYVSLKNPNTVEVPKLKSKKPKAFKSFRGELTTFHDKEVVVKPSGAVVIKQTKDMFAENRQDKITDKDILKANKIEAKEESENKETKKSRKRKQVEGELQLNEEDVIEQLPKPKKSKKKQTDQKQNVVQEKAVLEGKMRKRKNKKKPQKKGEEAATNEDPTSKMQKVVNKVTKIKQSQEVSANSEIEGKKTKLNKKAKKNVIVKKLRKNKGNTKVVKSK